MKDHQEGIAGRYAVFGLIASGGMATVHFGRLLGSAGFARTVAIKRLHERFARDSEFVAMFLDEARVVSRIRHPNVVQTLDVVATESELFMVMDYVHGESFSRLLRSATLAGTPVPLRVLVAIVAGMLHGLHAAHEATSESGEPLGVVHRDVSPHNVLVGVDGITRVLDFGVAKAAERIQTTRAGQLKGKLAYMAPEQLRDGALDRRTDVYAAAVVLWEALTMRRLFDASNEGAVVNQVLKGAVLPPSRIVASIPKELDAITMRGLHRDPDKRFASALEMAAALEAYAANAQPTEVGAWVASMARDSLALRTAQVADAEAGSSQVSASQARKAVSSFRLASLAPAQRIESARPVPVAHEGTLAIHSRSMFPSSGSLRPLVASTPPESSNGKASKDKIPPVAPARLRARAVVIASAVMFASALAVAVVLYLSLRPSTAVTLATPAVPATVETASAAANGESASSVVNACGAGMIAIPGGKFFMGSDDDLELEKPAHQVTVDPFCIDEFEVTTRAYKECSDSGECKRAGNANRGDGLTDKERAALDPLCNANQTVTRAQHPINCVDWEMADRFCSARGARLPTEAEWEFAARGPDGRKFPWGDEAPSADLLNACGSECVTWGKANHVEETAMYAADDGWPTTAPVGSFPRGKSRYGVQDVVGNVWEWVSDRHASYGAQDLQNPQGPKTGAERVIRGGAWNGAQPSWVRPTFRYHDVPEKRSYGIGFRCAR